MKILRNTLLAFTLGAFTLGAAACGGSNGDADTTPDDPAMDESYDDMDDFDDDYQPCGEMDDFEDDLGDDDLDNPCGDADEDW
jgi:hypothetical protein